MEHLREGSRLMTPLDYAMIGGIFAAFVLMLIAERKL